MSYLKNFILCSIVLSTTYISTSYGLIVTPSGSVVASGMGGSSSHKKIIHEISKEVMGHIKKYKELYQNLENAVNSFDSTKEKDNNIELLKECHEMSQFISYPYGRKMKDEDAEDFKREINKLTEFKIENFKELSEKLYKKIFSFVESEREIYYTYEHPTWIKPKDLLELIYKGKGEFKYERRDQEYKKSDEKVRTWIVTNYNDVKDKIKEILETENISEFPIMPTVVKKIGISDFTEKFPGIDFSKIHAPGTFTRHVFLSDYKFEYTSGKNKEKTITLKICQLKKDKNNTD